MVVDTHICMVELTKVKSGKRLLCRSDRVGRRKRRRLQQEAKSGSKSLIGLVITGDAKLWTDGRACHNGDKQGTSILPGHCQQAFCWVEVDNRMREGDNIAILMEGDGSTKAW